MTGVLHGQYDWRMQVAGIVFDVYDDTNKEILSALFDYATPNEKIASATLLSQEKLASLPDELFAVVAENGPGGLLRRYPMHDEVHTKLSTLYFLEKAHLFPVEVQKIAARNLIRACRWYDVTPPEPLLKVAFVGAALNAVGLASAGAEGYEKHKQQMQAYKAQQAAAGAKVASGDFLDDVLGLDKEADVAGTEIMPRSGQQIPQPPKTKLPGVGPLKTSAAWEVADDFIDEEWEPAGDLSKWNPPKPKKLASYDNFCLPHAQKYPIDTPGQVKQASAYFDENWMHFQPAERRIYADNLVSRADELGVKVSSKALEYAGNGYGPFIQGELVKRASAYEGTGHSVMYEALLEKLASIPPAAMASLLHETDVKLGADKRYGHSLGFRDPYAAVYGSKLREVEKLSEYSWSGDGVTVTGSELAALANSAKEKLDSLFGGGFGDTFAADPVSIFESMPDPQKATIARLAKG